MLPNGLTVISEEMPHIRSIHWNLDPDRLADEAAESMASRISPSTWSSRDQDTYRREIARQVDSIGGNMDAFTGKECICFNIKVLDEHLPIAVDILSDLVLNPTFDRRTSRGNKA